MEPDDWGKDEEWLDPEMDIMHRMKQPLPPPKPPLAPKDLPKGKTEGIALGTRKRSRVGELKGKGKTRRKARPFRVHFENSVSPEEQREILKIINDRRSWFQGDRRAVKCEPRSADWVVAFSYQDTPRFEGLSVTEMSRPPRTVFHRKNWEKVPAPSKYKTKGGYHTYVVNHELGHALGAGHRSAYPGKPTPVMVQQTLGQQGGTPNPFPLHEEIRSMN